ncbi:hypothetical protein OIU84_007610 [Salix udensis]|uniref:Secreted protein n=1 Tax=Salix udensis TaxID=889485 RepID=A0AAD6NZM2_9ROSI|nr:hypothetical protein OIU84_007610 [Salix udensis]
MLFISPLSLALMAQFLYTNVTASVRMNMSLATCTAAGSLVSLTSVTRIVTREFCMTTILPFAGLVARFSPFLPAEEQAVRGVRRKLDAENSNAPTDSCSFKRRRDAQFHPSPFERSFSAVSPICSQVGDGMDMS